MGDVESLVLEHLRALREGQDRQGERLDRIEARLSTMEHTLGLLYAGAGDDRDTVRKLERRIERIEKRLDLVD